VAEGDVINLPISRLYKEEEEEDNTACSVGVFLKVSTG